MKFTINSRKLGKAVTFSRPGNGHIFVDLNGREGTLGNQICDSGRLTGSTISYDGDSESEFKRACRLWWDSYLRRNADHI